jgi:hypothetical protein
MTINRTLIRISFLLLFFSIIAGLSGCISFRSEIEGAYASSPAKNLDAPRVSVFFHFSHLEQYLGLDVVPKIVNPRRGFRDIFGESLKEFSNIKNFSTFTDNDNDIDNVERRLMRDSMKLKHDFTIHVTIKKEHSFTTHFLSGILSFGTLMVVPVFHTWDYIVSVDVNDPMGKSLKSYSRRAVLTTWQQLLFFIIYPFYPEDVKTEEIYLETLRDTFRQIESEKVLVK